MYQKLILINFFIFSILSNFLKTQYGCSQGCMQCNQSGECLQCQDGYYQDQESQQCLEIATRVLYNVKSCSEDEGCAQCSEDGLCQECKDGYYDTEIYKNDPNPKKECNSCQYGYNDCIQCNSRKCVQCIENYEYIGYKQQCMQTNIDPSQYKCDEGCEKCNFAGMCSECSDGYHKEDVVNTYCDYTYTRCNKTCTTLKNCLECDGYTQICAKCKDQYNYDKKLKLCV
ncbi:hypothetical protein IMG5_139800 [Ichthyophthirius multifiliis]|uniref:Furin n=1 Tax=Ichthyophthirius multifiliis TaxID=5932 RepID=G0QX96_ICHMU|nr:hypothetical protein IMG5_139800 [Ichthyophthirius multifiliis]EGR30159.1 hypothetical protein IMG5_139800 [Ichthyophthirius multifiliis]|eukprot:XP_004031395.1 hypothetical protein IMG5_139800 [Ichthyophthirius multifiliis]